MLDLHPEKEVGLANSSRRLTSPFERPSSYRLIGFIRMVAIRRVPVCGVSPFAELEPVK